jgi:hypothetical protein
VFPDNQGAGSGWLVPIDFSQKLIIFSPCPSSFLYNAFTFVFHTFSKKVMSISSHMITYRNIIIHNKQKFCESWEEGRLTGRQTINIRAKVRHTLM